MKFRLKRSLAPSVIAKTKEPEARAFGRSVLTLSRSTTFPSVCIRKHTESELTLLIVKGVPDVTSSKLVGLLVDLDRIFRYLIHVVSPVH